MPALRAEFINWTQSGGGKREKNKYARMSDIAYAKGIKAKRERLKKYDPTGAWTIDAELSGRDATVFKSSKTGEVVVAIRGTDIKSSDTRWRDIRSDIAIALGVSRYTGRTSEINKLVDQVEQKYDKKPTLSGHSLGGRTAANVARKRNLRAVIFNQGSSPLDAIGGIAQRLGFVKNAGDIKHYHTSTKGRIDPVSVSASVLEPGEAVEAKDTEKSAHSLSQFVDEGEQIGDGKKRRKPRANKWIQHVKACQKKHGISYRDALKKASATYKR